MKNCILWYQPADLSERDVIVHNGTVVEQDMSRASFFSELKKISGKVSDVHRPWAGNVDGHYLVKGSFDSRDEKGRLLSFTFSSDTVDDRESLLKIVEGLGQTLDRKTIECVNKETEVKPKNKYQVIFLIAVSLVLLAVVLYALHNNNC